MPEVKAGAVRDVEEGHGAWRRSRVILLVIAICTIATFVQVCWHDFTWWDDGYTVHHNEHFNPPSVKGILYYWGHAKMGLYVPVTYTVWGVLAFLGRVEDADQVVAMLNPWVFHTANLLVHVCCAMVVFGILRKLIRKDWPAAMGALLFALHPVQVETVAWVSGMKDLLCGLFTLLAIWQYIEAATEMRSRRVHYAIATVCFVLGFLCKPTAMVAPVMVGVIDYFLMKRPGREIGRWIALWVVLLIPMMIVARWVQSGEGVPTSEIALRPLIAMDALAFYVYKLVWPVWLGMDYGRTPEFIRTQGAVVFGHMVPWIYLSWVLTVGLAVVIWRSRVDYLRAGALLFVAGMLPTIGVVPFLFQYYSTTADHYLYLPMLGVGVVVAGLMARYRAVGVRVVVVAVLVALAVRSSLQTGYWADDLTLYTHDLAVNPKSVPANLNLGRVMLQRGDAAQALYYMERAVESNPNYKPAREQLAALRAAIGSTAPATTTPDKQPN